MHFIFWCVLWVVGLGTLAYLQISLVKSLGIIALGWCLSYLFGFIWGFVFVIGLILGAATSILLIYPQARQKFLIHPLLNKFKGKIPKISDTEQEALDAGTVWWDGQLFSGNPDWQYLVKFPAPKLTPEEQAFIDGPVTRLCAIINNWQINQELKDLPPAMWEFLKQEKFFALMIPKEYGGLGFSYLAHSEILAKIAGKSITVASTVSVPNSLGPAELILNYGTPEQKQYYLPRLASGQDIPCFALTSPEAGSDATAIIDRGVVCKQNYNGVMTLGIQLNWNKRYITLAPIATVMGLAFKLQDPSKLLGDKIDIGITCALIPTSLPGITIGKRHWPLETMFQNGPTQGKDVFIPIDAIIGGPAMAGKGWKMLVESLSCGRAISLPSVTAGKARTNAGATGAYARIRKQFNVSIAKFEGIEEPLARIATNLYICTAARKLTAASIDNGAKPTVPGAIVKYHVTERTRQIAIDAMDIHGGKGIMQGPNNYIADSYINAPVAITVEGANILTRSLIIFGQGAIRCHPYIMRELTALQNNNDQIAASDFDKVLSEHVRYTLNNCSRSFVAYVTRGRFINPPINSACSKYFQYLTWASHAFAVLADASLMILGAKLKFKEKLSARLGDLLALLYLSSCTLKQFIDAEQPVEDLALLEWSMTDLLHNFWRTVDEILSNFPNKPIAFALRLIIMPFGNPIAKPSDNLGKQVAQLLTEPNATRDRLLDGAYLVANNLNPVGQLELALKQVIAAEPIEQRIAQAAKDQMTISLNAEETEILRQAQSARANIVAVDFFDPSVMQATAPEAKHGSNPKARLANSGHQ